MKAEAPASLLQAPANINVVAGDAENRVEASDRFQTGPAKRHVAPGQMLGNSVSD
jgi:hypothetical protein